MTLTCMSQDFLDVLREARKHGVVVVNVTQCKSKRDQSEELFVTAVTPLRRCRGKCDDEVCDGTDIGSSGSVQR